MKDRCIKYYLPYCFSRYWNFKLTKDFQITHFGDIAKLHGALLVTSEDKMCMEAFLSKFLDKLQLHPIEHNN